MMFDWVNYKGPLPASIKKKSRVWDALSAAQSKSLRLWEAPEWRQAVDEDGCLEVMVSKGGALLDPNGVPMSWSGNLNFYTGAAYLGWLEFTAKIVDGQVISIVEVRNE